MLSKTRKIISCILKLVVIIGAVLGTYLSARAGRGTFMGGSRVFMFLNWGGPAGAFGFLPEFPYMGCVWWILLLMVFLFVVAWVYLIIADLMGKNKKERAS
ncbi:MAG: hypothetical protein IKG97_00560 [Lachnospiraceae bacterium]|nr:hypothetical protein [Lachnospiraceae bacterium]